MGHRLWRVYAPAILWAHVTWDPLLSCHFNVREWRLVWIGLAGEVITFSLTSLFNRLFSLFVRFVPTPEYCFSLWFVMSQTKQTHKVPKVVLIDLRTKWTFTFSNNLSSSFCLCRADILERECTRAGSSSANLDLDLDQSEAPLAASWPMGGGQVSVLVYSASVRPVLPLLNSGTALVRWLAAQWRGLTGGDVGTEVIEGF